MMERMNARVLVLALHHNAIARSHCHDCILLIVCARSVSVSQPGLRGVSRCVAISSGGPTGLTTLLRLAFGHRASKATSYPYEP